MTTTSLDDRPFTTVTQMKGTVLRGYVQALDRLGWRTAVAARVSRPTRSLMDRLPLDSAWVSATPFEELAVAVEALHGSAGVRRAARESVNSAVVPVLKVIIEGFLRLFGASPATLFSRMGQMTAATVRGIEYVWTPTSDHSGTILLLYPGRTDVPPAQFMGSAGSFEVAFELCGVQGRVEDPKLSPAHPGFGATLAVSW